MKTRIIPYFGGMYLDEISTAHIVKFMTDLRNPNIKIGKRLDDKPGSLKSASLVYVFRVLKSIFSKAVQWGKLEKKPMIGVDKPEENDVKSPQSYNEEELTQLFAALDDFVTRRDPGIQDRYTDSRLTFRAIIVLDITTGMRRAELVGLKRSKIDLNKGECTVLETIPAFENGEPVIKLPKNNQPRKFALTESVVEELRELLAYQDARLREVSGISNVIDFDQSDTDMFVFQNLATGDAYAPSSICKMWRSFHEYYPELKYIPFHGIRHTATSIMIAKNVHALAIANWLRWRSTKMVDRYGKIFESVDEAAAAVFESVLPKKKTSE